MPLLDSFIVDHTRTEAPVVRAAKTMNTSHGDAITVFDLRFCVPDKEMMSKGGIHVLEHLLAGFMRNHLNSNGVEIIDISPMGCRTGFYMSLTGTPDEQHVTDTWKAAMKDVPKVQDQNQIPELNIYRYDTYQMYSLQGAQGIACNILEHDVRINSNEELALPKEKSQELHIWSVNYLHNQLGKTSPNELVQLYLVHTASAVTCAKWRFNKPHQPQQDEEYSG